MVIDDVADALLPSDMKATIKAWGITFFTQVQIEALQAGIATGSSQIVCAPTSSGKTLVGEIAILSALNDGLNCLYLVSHRALADQKYLDFRARFGEDSESPLASIGLSTGDRDEGDISPRVLIATYEKALALLLTGQLNPNSILVVADELQIINELSRGPNIETLCTILRQRGVSRFVALTATVGNAQEIADWLQCELVGCNSRDVDLHQEIWAGGRAHSVRFGEDEGQPCHTGIRVPDETIAAVRHLVSLKRGPVLVFTESRQEAIDQAERYSQTLPRTPDGIVLAEQLELFSEPTESSQQLQRHAQKRVAFHTADLTSQERQVLEKGFAESAFDVCFATSTLAAGVNFPFKSVVFSKLTYQFGDRQGQMIVRSDYRNMSGRAGRLGLHTEGYAILLPQNGRELNHANRLVLPENDNVESKLVSLSMRRTVLALISSQVVSDRTALSGFFQHTLYWHQIRERNPKKLDDVASSATAAADWLVANALVDADGAYLFPTPVGRAVAQSGLLPSTAVDFIALMRQQAATIEAAFEAFVPGLIHWICQSKEFQGETPSRFLPYPSRGPTNSTGFLQANRLLAPLNRVDARANQNSHALFLFSRGDQERLIRQQTNISSGQLHRVALDAAWVLDGLRKVVSVPELGFPQTLTNKLTMLARQLEWGAPVEALDILRVAVRGGVPGFGRQRAVALMRQGIETFDKLLSCTKDALSKILGNETRAAALLTAVASSAGFGIDRYQKTHADLAARLGIGRLVQKCEDEIGTEYEVAIKNLLEHGAFFSVHVLDDGKQQNVPDLMIRLGPEAVLVECKTTTKNPPIIKKEEAFAVLQKAADYFADMRRVTLGKPAFDEHSKKKAQASGEISLVEHVLFVEAILRLNAKEISPQQFLQWLSTPGVAELDRLAGRASYEIVRGD